MKRCEIGGCYRQPIESCHIKSDGSGGSNRKHNKINLCSYHHRTAKDSFHNIGVWSFAKLHGLTDKFEVAFDKEAAIDKIRRERNQKSLNRRKEKSKRICPTCKRRWSKGVIQER